jgi:hypothetical protein
MVMSPGNWEEKKRKSNKLGQGCRSISGWLQLHKHFSLSAKLDEIQDL